MSSSSVAVEANCASLAPTKSWFKKNIMKLNFNCGEYSKPSSGFAESHVERARDMNASYAYIKDQVRNSKMESYILVGTGFPVTFSAARIDP